MPPAPSSASSPSSGLLSESEALARVLAAVRPLGTERVPLALARGRFAARERFAEIPLPGFDNSSMDGYALPAPSADDGDAGYPPGSKFRVVGEQPAGRARRELRVGPGEAVRIFTGAPLPAGAGAVVMQEDVEVDTFPATPSDDDRNGVGEARTILLREAVSVGENVRRAGGDLSRGQRILAPGEPLTAATLALLASQGWAETEVGRRPRVVILATGDELRQPDPDDGRGGAGVKSLAPGEIYESNGVLLAALAGEIAGAENVRVVHAPDEPEALDAALRGALAAAETIVVAGGMSVGERDLVRGRLTALGVRLDLWRVAVRPGKPFAYGRGPEGGDDGAKRPAHVFGLPGNPVSAFVTFLLFVRPALRRLMGAGESSLSLPAYPATAAVALSNAGGDRPHYLRGTLDAAGRFGPAGRQESHALFALSRSRALVRLEPGETVPAGAPVRVLVWA